MLYVLKVSLVSNLCFTLRQLEGGGGNIEKINHCSISSENRSPKRKIGYPILLVL